MVIIKVLKRNDAASIVVAVALAVIGAGAISALSNSITNALTGTNPTFENGYLYPMLAFLLQLLLLEAGLRAIIFLRATYLRSV